MQGSHLVGDESLRPYLLRAVHEWCCDMAYTPHIVVVVRAGCEVPLQFVSDGRIVFNIAVDAVQALEISDQWIRFRARFQGAPFQVSVPLWCVVAVFAQENQQGFYFSLPPEEDEEAAVMEQQLEEEVIEEDAAASKKPVSRPAHLRVIK